MNKKGTITINEAVETLSSLAELDSESPKEEKQIEWLNPQDKQAKVHLVKESLKTVTSYLKDVYQDQKESFKDPTLQRGVQAIMVLAGEAAQKVDRFSQLFQDQTQKKSLTELDEFKELQDFYLTKIARRFEETLQEEEAWASEWGALEESELDLERKSLKDLETVKRDRDYELFYLKKPDGKPFFNRNLIRHIRLVADIDEFCKEAQGEDFSLHLRRIVDKRLHLAAKAILDTTEALIKPFYKEALKHKDLAFVMKLNCSLMALMCAANPHNLLQNTEGKSSLLYFSDFQAYLREALKSEDYYHFIIHPPHEKKNFSVCVMNLIHRLSYAFFTHRMYSSEVIALVYRLFGNKPSPFANFEKPLDGHSLLEIDEAIREALRAYPNGPLLKTFALFTTGNPFLGFDPLKQGNIPSLLFDVHADQSVMRCLRMPSPTMQATIQEAEIVPEFKAFFREESSPTYLLFDLQDRTKVEEHARSQAIVSLSLQKQFQEQFHVIGFAKHTPFYFQTENYLTMDDASEFKIVFQDQLQSDQLSGFYFPSSFVLEEAFFPQLMETIHEVFFGNKQTLTRKERLDFIEITYAFISLKALEYFSPQFFSFTCKDAIDVSAVFTVFFYLFLECLVGEEMGNQKRDLLLSMLYDPALTIRERVTDIQRVHRMISAFSMMDKAVSEQSDLGSFFQQFFKLNFKKLKIKMES